MGVLKPRDVLMAENSTDKKAIRKNMQHHTLSKLKGDDHLCNWGTWRESKVACYDVPGVYLHTMNDEEVITFRSNIKYLLLKLLCTLARLCEGTPLNHLYLTSLESGLLITIVISNFLRVGQT